MNIQQLFESFLDTVVNLNKDRINRIKGTKDKKGAQEILSDFIKNHEDFKGLHPEAVPQGSYRQKTIIKPVKHDGAFDVDLLIKLEENTEWKPVDYLIKLTEAFKKSGRYNDLTETHGKTRCVTIDYEGDFHVDLVPAIERNGKWFIFNKSTNEEEKTDGDGYAQWFEQRDAVANGNLVLVVRLIKYLRDSKGEFETKSIILTTLAGKMIRPEDNYSDLPHATYSILERMNEFLAQFNEAPSIENPAMPDDETFDRHWKGDDSGFGKLKSAIDKYAGLAAEAMAASDEEVSLKYWKKLFGNDFPDGNKVSGSSSINLPPRPTPGPYTPPMPPRRREVG